VEWLVFGANADLPARMAVRYLAYVIYRRDVDLLDTKEPLWSELTPAQRKACERRAQAELEAWVLTQGAPLKD
jgi:hypothetical protein